ncbi:dihydrolipoyl dehydrogenase [Ferrovum myxofaciens]|jgi:dihydrolipoamide dehydrogenase|nr:dihydrolipoyl dehydrogenase [Ferrovum myxofaciens]QKE40222.1 MAG: dihydrolipoyl dehydrogenase [Ferrovum myxofaciens]
MQSFDLVVIGAGPGGYMAALRAAQLGLRVACVDEGVDGQQRPSPGGTCLNVGCIPSKALLESSALYARIIGEAAGHGIDAGPVQLDVARMQARKEKIVRQLTAGVGYLFKKNGVSFMPGRASFKGKEGDQIHLTVQRKDQEREDIAAAQVIIATGSVPRTLESMPFDQERILDSTGGLALTTVPRQLVILGAGVIGLELGSVWQRLGSSVTLLETRDIFLPEADQEVAQQALKILTQSSGLRIELGIHLEAVEKTTESLNLTYTSGGESRKLCADVLILAVGRCPNTKGLELERVGLAPDGQGRIPVDAHCRTPVPGVWAIGDVVRGPMLAHKAEEEGVAVAERLAGQLPEVNLVHIPAVIYTEPELAWVGLTEEAAQAAGRAVRIGRFPFQANGRAKARGAPQGLVKVIACAVTDRILGVHILGPEASELIAEAVVALEFQASSEDLARIVHAHPSLSEALREACLGVDGRTLNL